MSPWLPSCSLGLLCSAAAGQSGFVGLSDAQGPEGSVWAPEDPCPLPVVVTSSALWSFVAWTPGLAFLAHFSLERAQESPVGRGHPRGAHLCLVQALPCVWPGTGAQVGIRTEALGLTTWLQSYLCLRSTP